MFFCYPYSLLGNIHYIIISWDTLQLYVIVVIFSLYFIMLLYCETRCFHQANLPKIYFVSGSLSPYHILVQMLLTNVCLAPTKFYFEYSSTEFVVI
jgi:hypothetical protein